MESESFESLQREDKTPPQQGGVISSLARSNEAVTPVLKEARKEVERIFAEIPISKFPPPRGGKVLCVYSDECIRDVAEYLSQHKILSAPVINKDSPSDANWTERYLGMVDLVNIAMFIYQQINDERLKEEGEGSAKGTAFSYASSGEEPRELSAWDQFAVFCNEKVDRITTSARYGPFIALPEDSSLLDAVRILGLYQVHRLPVVRSGEGNLVNLLTQSAVIAQAAEALAEGGSGGLGPIGDLTLKDCNLGSKSKLRKVNEGEDVTRALELMARGYNAVAVVDDEGFLVANISVSDIRHLASSPTLFTIVRDGCSIRRFIELLSGGWDDKKLLFTPVVCTPTSTMAEVMKTLSAYKIHRVYLVEDRENAVKTKLAQGGEPPEAGSEVLQENRPGNMAEESGPQDSRPVESQYSNRPVKHHAMSRTELRTMHLKPLRVISLSDILTQIVFPDPNENFHNFFVANTPEYRS